MTGIRPVPKLAGLSRSAVRRRFSASRPTTCCRPCRTQSGQLFRHVEPRMTRRLAIDAASTIEAFCKNVGEPLPARCEQIPERGQGLFWNRRTRQRQLVSTIEPDRDRQRHRRKYAEGELGEGESFYFRGPDGALNLRAQNLVLFVQLAEGVDDRTWTYHLRAGDYSRWLREQVKDDELADEVSNIEGDERLSPAQSRSQIKEAIARRYTGPA